MIKRKPVLVWLVFLLLAACAKATPAPSATTTAAAAPAGSLLYKDSSQPVEARVADLLGRMSLDQKIGQMTQASNTNLTPGDITNYALGAVLSAGDGFPPVNTLSGWTAMIDGYQKEALATPLAVPILYGIDAVHGIGLMRGATIFPHNVGLGAARDADLVRLVGQATAEEMLAGGLTWNFAPVVAVPQDVRWGRTYEGYSEDTALVSRLGAAYIQGLQSVPAGTTPAPGQILGVLATPKHYLGDGGTVWKSSRQDILGVPYLLDQGNLQAEEQTVRALYLPPYQAAVDAGALSVMISYSSWNGTPMHAQRYLITTVLKGELGFRGFVVSDFGGIAQIDPSDYYTSVVTAVNAGIDMGMISDSYSQFISTVRQGVQNGDITQERIDDAATRILRVKFLLGLFDHPLSDPAYQSAVRSDAHLETARRAVRESLVLLKNDGRALPIDKNVPLVLVAGVGADNTGMQSGGWTNGWQGAPTNDVVGSTILAGIRAIVGGQTQVIYRSGGMFNDISGTAPVGIAVVGELPYAEGVGDRADLRLSADDVDTINRLRSKVDKLIVIILSGRPLVITDEFRTADAWVAAWLPGSEADAIAGVLFGDYPFTGALPYTWPRSNSQLPLNENNDAGLTGCNAPLFPYGYGLGRNGSAPIPWIDCPES
jgi:beta-glucosidase